MVTLRGEGMLAWHSWDMGPGIARLRKTIIRNSWIQVDSVSLKTLKTTSNFINSRRISTQNIVFIEWVYTHKMSHDTTSFNYIPSKGIRSHLQNVPNYKVTTTKRPNHKMSQATSIPAVKRPKYKMSQATKRPKLQKVPTTKDTNGQMSYHEDAQLKSILNTSKDNMFNLLICKYFR